MKPKKAAGIIIAFIISFPSLTYAQPNIEKVIREADRPVREEVEEKLRVPPKKKPEIKEEKEAEIPEGPTFFIKKINLVGVESFSPDEFKPLIEEYENKENSLEELNILAKQIEREYLKRGVIAACFIPPQEIKDGIVTLQIVEAKMGELEVQDHKYFNKKRVYYYWAIKPGEVLRYDKLSRSLQLMNKNPDREVKATLHAGKKPQTTDVLLSAKTHLPVHSIFTFDREGSPYTGLNRTGFGIRHNNVLGFDDTLLTGYSYGSDFYGRYIYHTIPVTGFGTSFLYGFSRSIARPKMDYEAFELKSRADNTSFFLYQDLFKKDDYMGEVHFGLDMKDKIVRLRNRTTNQDVLRILRLGGNFIVRGNRNVTYIIPEFSRGINALWAKPKNFYTSRGAEHTFSKYSLGIKHRLSLPLNLQMGVNLKGQLAGEKLTPQEQFSLGGIDSIRGYPSGDYLADIAFQVNTEFLIPATFLPEELKIAYAPNPLKDDITGVVFFDYGYGQKREATGMENMKVNLASMGAGVRIRLFNQGLLRLEWGFPVGGYEPTRGSTGGRFHISLSIEDQMHRELERILKEIKANNIDYKAWNLVNGELQRPDSLLRQKLYSELLAAQRAYKDGDFENARKHYVNVIKVGKSLHAQARNYVQRSMKQIEGLREENKLASEYCKNGDYQKAKNLYQKIIEEAKPKQLVLEF